MADLKKGENKVTAKANISFDKAGITTDNCIIIHQAGQQPKSYNPAHKLNSLKQFEKGKEYLIRMKQDLDVTKL